MRIVIDMQGAQGVNGQRGVGRYTLSITQAIIRNRGNNEVFLALNGLFPDTIEFIRASFNNILPPENILVWYAPGPVLECEPSNDSRREVAECIREAFLASLKPDIIIISSLFEGLNDNAVTSVGVFSSKIPTAVILYDLIPFIYRDVYLKNPIAEKWYENKLEYLHHADLLLSISESSRQEGIKYLGFSDEVCVNILTAADSQFKPVKINAEREKEVCERYGLLKPFVMYTGGIDPRKNIEGLIRAYAMLPESLRDNHQLAIVCSIHPPSRIALEMLAKENGLKPSQLVLTGFVPEEDLLTLYNLCKTLIFPSWHEGFGLPVLEAMSCGRAVIGSNVSSIPEIIGLEEALFDPRDDKSMALKMEQVLSDKNFRHRLEKNGLEQAKKFSWDQSARKAILVMEKWIAENNKKTILVVKDKKLPKLAYISPLPPLKSGISFYSAELLPELSKYYQIDVIVNQTEVTDKWIKSNCNIKTVEWFKKNSSAYNRVLYHIGNSEFHQHMFELLENIPGNVVLHDFFISSIVAHMDVTGYRPSYWAQTLYIGHGYKAVYERYHAKDTADVVWKYTTNLPVVQNAKSVIVNAKKSISSTKQLYGERATKKFSVIPQHLRVADDNIQRPHAKEIVGLPIKSLIISTFGMLGITKLNHRLLTAFLDSSLSKDPDCYLVFVGENNTGEYGKRLLLDIKNSKAKDRIIITGWTNEKTFCHYLEATDIGVQLRTHSRGGTSRAALDCMNYKIPTIVNANETMAELPKDSVVMIPDDFTDAELVLALEFLYENEQKRTILGEEAKKVIKTEHDPSVCAKQYSEVIEKVYTRESTSFPALINSLVLHKGLSLEESELVELSNCLAQDFPLEPHKKQFFLDISELVERDNKTGIQRVVRSLLKELIDNPPEGYRIEPVYATIDQGYRYARRFTLKFLDCPDSILFDDPIEFQSGDFFLGLDLQPRVVPAQQTFYKQLRNQGVQVRFLVYDLLPITLPKTFPKEAEKLYLDWLNVVVESDGVICISKAVADEVSNWLKVNKPSHKKLFKIDWFHLGSDVENSVPTRGFPDNSSQLLKNLARRPTFLTIGTIEPRKGHTQILDAFELLWKQDVEINLVIVGKQGWMVESLVERLRKHPENNKYLFWLEGISDEYLEKIYSASTCLINASEGEGFGLPLIEAARHKLPIIARDIPVFREVAGKHATYFSGFGSEDLFMAIKKWLVLYAKKEAMPSTNIPWLTWRQSAQQFLRVIFSSNEQ